VVDSKEVPSAGTYQLRFYTEASRLIHASRYELLDSATQRAVFSFGSDFHGEGRGPVGEGLLPVISTPDIPTLDSVNSVFVPGSLSNAQLRIANRDQDSSNIRRPGYPDDFSIRFAATYIDTSLLSIIGDPIPVKFTIAAETPGGPMRMPFYFFDADNDSTLGSPADFIDLVTYIPGDPTPRVTWRIQIDTTGQSAIGPLVPPAPGDVYDAAILRPYSADDLFSFNVAGQVVDPALAREQYRGGPYVVPNPYVGAAAFEPERFAVTGRGERRMEFRGLPTGAVIRIYTVAGHLVQTLRHDGSDDGYVPWNLRTKDNLDVAPGLFVYHVEAEGVDPFIGKFAIIK
jgi:hypothetical protein